MSYVTGAHLVRSHMALGMSQAAFGEMMGVSRSTVVRWTRQGGASMLPDRLRLLVGALHPVDAKLAAEIAAHNKDTLESLGIVPPPQPAPAPGVVQPPAPPPLHPLVVDTVVCAAAEVVGQPPASLRPVLIAAFERAQAVGLSVDAVLAGLRSGTGAKPAKRA